MLFNTVAVNVCKNTKTGGAAVRSVNRVQPPQTTAAVPTSSAPAVSEVLACGLQETVYNTAVYLRCV